MDESRKAVLEDLVAMLSASWRDPANKAAVAPRPNPIAPLANGGAISDIIGEEVQAALLGQKTAQEAADAMQERLEAELD